MARLVGLIEAKDSVGEAGLDVLLEVADLTRTVQHGNEDGTGELAHPSGLPGAPVDHTGDGESGVHWCGNGVILSSPSNLTRAGGEARNVNVSDVGDAGLLAVVAHATVALGGGRSDRLGGGGLGGRRGGLGGARSCLSRGARGRLGSVAGRGCLGLGGASR